MTRNSLSDPIRSFRSPTEAELEVLSSKLLELHARMSRYANFVGGHRHSGFSGSAHESTVALLRDSAFEVEQIFNPDGRPWNERLFVYLIRPRIDGWPVDDLSEALQWIHSAVGELLRVMNWTEMSVGRLVIDTPDNRGPGDVDHGGDIYRRFDPSSFVWPTLEPQLMQEFTIGLRQLVGIVQTAKWQASELEMEYRTFQEAKANGVASVTFTMKRGDAGTIPETAGGDRSGQELGGGPVDRQPQGSDGSRYPTPENFERDKWIYERSEAGQTIPGIKRELNQTEWYPLDSDNGIREAAKRYATHAGLPISKTRPGKPRLR